MARINLTRQNRTADEGKYMDCFLTVADGQTESDKRALRKLLAKIFTSAPGEMFVFDHKFIRSSPFHRRCMAIEGAVFDAQEQFEDRDMFRNWLKLNVEWVRYVPAESGKFLVIPRSISFSKTDDQQFREYWEKVVKFLRSGPVYLWPHMTRVQAQEMIEAILDRFEE